jgi:transcriptional regulator GlxA family with amidase domain
MAAAGVLDGHRATTHWEDLDKFAARFPDVTTLDDRYHVDGARMTCGGAAPAIDMMLQLIAERFGAALAARVAGVFIHDPRARADRIQRRLPLPANHSALTARASALMEATLDAPLPLGDIAAQSGASLRALQSQFHKRLGTTPQAHYLALRLAEAHRLVTDTDLPLTDIALACGFASQSSFARAFRSAHKTSARALRKG